ncbi:sensor histidine kinase [Citromicrobium bathyomarinum]|uniref:sensor histidine kinase n=1 Tax=Citromicrobium bathyomarinum TaxID=72174 RepID=UPI003159ED23
MNWVTADTADPSLLWNPAAISYLSQLLLAVVLATYLLRRAFANSRQDRFEPATWLLAILMLSLVPALFTSMLRVLTGGGWLSYAMPWSDPGGLATLAMPWARPFGAIAPLAMIALAYLFPKPLRGVRREMQVVTFFLAGLIAAETAIAVRADIAMIAREAWWRPQWLAGWMHLGMIWAAIVFWRQLRAAQPIDSQRDTRKRLLSRLALLWRPAPSREAKVARAFLFLTVLPILHTAALFFPDESLSNFPFDILICWLVLLQLVGLTLVLVGYLPERTTFLFKLTIIGFAVLLAAVNGAAWVVAPAYQEQFRAPDLPSSGDALLFVPRGGDRGYAAQPTVFLPERVRGPVLASDGERIDLPFDFPFYGRMYDHVYVGALGTIAFGRVPHPVDAAFDDGSQPAIYPMLVELPESGTQITAVIDDERLVVTRRDRCDQKDMSRCYRIQTILHSDGRIAMQFLDVPQAPRFAMLSPLEAPWLIGITPGRQTDAGSALLRDHYRIFMVHQDRLFAPFVLFILLTALAALIGLPLIFRSFLLAPLERLMNGIRRYREGDSDTQVPVAFSDEIGFLIESFNALAREQTALTRRLEDRVADRVSEIADMTIQSTKLEERARLSADLHDAIAQTLASAALHASALPTRLHQLAPSDREAAEQVARLNRHALSEMRHLLSELRDEGEQGSLTHRLSELVESFTRLHALKVECDIHETALLPPEVIAMFYRVAQESLNNVLKHSGVSEVELVFDAMEDRALLSVSDAGRGFDPTAGGRRERLGLSIMRDRAATIGATLEIDSAPQQGCRVTMIWFR